MKRFSKTFFLKIALLASVAAIFFACQKDINGDGLIPPGTDPNTNVDLTTKVSAASISGFVTDESGIALPGATVTIGTATVITDKYGYFITRNVDVVKNAAVVTVNKAGYFKGIKTYTAEAGKSAFFRLKLLAKNPGASFPAAAGGTVTSTEGIKITFPAGAIVQASGGAAYTGTVSVAVRWIDPTAADLAMRMPGDLRGIDSANTVKKLTTYGMAAVELTGASGELLQIATGKKATLTMPLPAEIAAGAPSSIPLWHFDEAIGLWKQEGSAIKTGNTYVGEVSHFSFWNCDVPSQYVQFNCTLKSAAGVPLAFTIVKISSIANPQNAGYGITDSSGYVSGAIPNNSALKLEVFPSADCATPVYSQTINTTNVTLSLGTVTVAVPATNLANVSGTVINCNNAPVTNGYVVLRINNTNYRQPLTSTGTYSFVHILCNGSEAGIFTGEDLSSGQQSSATVNYTIQSGNNVIPAIQACGTSIAQFASYSARGVNKSLIFPADSFAVYTSQNSVSVNIFAPAGPNNNSLSFNFPSGNITVGSTLEVTNLLSALTPPLSYTVPAPIMLTVTEYTGSGGFISGNFTCTLNERDQSLPPGSPPGAPFTFTCNFRVKAP